MKNKLFQLGDSLLRILDSSGDLVLVIDCAKQTMPVWISVSDIALYKPISEENLANVIGNIPELETLDNEQIRTMHERYTMIVEYSCAMKSHFRKFGETVSSFV